MIAQQLLCSSEGDTLLLIDLILIDYLVERCARHWHLVLVLHDQVSEIKTRRGEFPVHGMIIIKVTQEGNTVNTSFEDALVGKSTSDWKTKKTERPVG